MVVSSPRRNAPSRNGTRRFAHPQPIVVLRAAPGADGSPLPEDLEISVNAAAAKTKKQKKTAARSLTEGSPQSGSGAAPRSVNAP